MKKAIKKIFFSSPTLYHYFVKYYQNYDSFFYRGSNTYKIKDVVVCGMQRSGSTLLFNIVNEVIAKGQSQRDTFFEREILYKKLLESEQSAVVKKNHTYLPLVARRVKKGLSVGFFTHRDIRDVIVSSIQKGWVENVDDWIEDGRIRYMANNALLYAQTPNMCVISYHQLMNHKVEVINEVAKKLSLTLGPEDIDDIYQKTSIKNTKKRLTEIPQEKKRLFTDQLHKNHIADGKSGKWQEHLTNRQAATVTELTKDFITYFGYDLSIRQSVAY